MYGRDILFLFFPWGCQKAHQIILIKTFHIITMCFKLNGTVLLLLYFLFSIDVVVVVIVVKAAPFPQHNIWCRYHFYYWIILLIIFVIILDIYPISAVIIGSTGIGIIHYGTGSTGNGIIQYRTAVLALPLAEITGSMLELPLAEIVDFEPLLDVSNACKTDIKHQTLLVNTNCLYNMILVIWFVRDMNLMVRIVRDMKWKQHVNWIGMMVFLSCLWRIRHGWFDCTRSIA